MPLSPTPEQVAAMADYGREKAFLLALLGIMDRRPLPTSYGELQPDGTVVDRPCDPVPGDMQRVIADFLAGMEQRSFRHMRQHLSATLYTTLEETLAFPEEWVAAIDTELTQEGHEALSRVRQRVLATRRWVPRPGPLQADPETDS